MARVFRVPESRSLTACVLQINLAFSLWLYDVSDEYMLFVLFVMATTCLNLLWMFGMLRGTFSQVLAVIVFFTWPFSKLASESDVFLAWNDILLVRIVAGFATIWSLMRLPSSLPRTFSFAELCVVMQLLIPFLSVSSTCVISRLLGADHSFCGSNTPATILKVISVGLAMFVIMCSVITSRFRRRRPELVVVAFAVSVALIYWAIARSLHMEPISWLLRYLFHSQSRRYLMFKWTVCLASNLVFAVMWTKTTTGNAGPKIRKVFHIGISAVFVFGIREDPQLLSFCSAALTGIFIVSECWRVCRLWPVAHALDACINCFKDEKDAGLIVTTPIYLLIGCALPLWLLPDGHSASLVTFSGVISIGIGDTAASVVGSYGHMRWSKSKKTVEGSLAALIAQLLASVAIWYLLNPHQLLSLSEVLILTLVSAVVAVIEAQTKDIDNLILPLYHHVLMLFAKLYFPRL